MRDSQPCDLPSLLQALDRRMSRRTRHRTMLKRGLIAEREARIVVPRTDQPSQLAFHNARRHEAEPRESGRHDPIADAR